MIQAYISEGIFASLSKQEVHECLAGISAIFLRSVVHLHCEDPVFKYEC